MPKVSRWEGRGGGEEGRVEEAQIRAKRSRDVKSSPGDTGSASVITVVPGLAASLVTCTWGHQDALLKPSHAAGIKN